MVFFCICNSYIFWQTANFCSSIINMNNNTTFNIKKLWNTAGHFHFCIKFILNMCIALRRILQESFSLGQILEKMPWKFALNYHMKTTSQVNINTSLDVGRFLILQKEIPWRGMLFQHLYYSIRWSYTEGLPAHIERQTSKKHRYYQPTIKLPQDCISHQ